MKTDLCWSWFTLTFHRSSCKHFITFDSATGETSLPTFEAGWFDCRACRCFAAAGLLQLCADSSDSRFRTKINIFLHTWIFSFYNSVKEMIPYKHVSYFIPQKCHCGELKIGQKFLKRNVNPIVLTNVFRLLLPVRDGILSRQLGLADRLVQMIDLLPRSLLWKWVIFVVDASKFFVRFHCKKARSNNAVEDIN